MAYSNRNRILIVEKSGTTSEELKEFELQNKLDQWVGLTASENIIKRENF